MIRSFFLWLILMTSAVAAEQRLYFGTYSRGDSSSEGIYTAKFDDETGQLSPPTLAVEADNPSFLAVHPDRRLLFACNETADFTGKPTGAVSAFSVDAASGQLTLINQQPSGGGAPCHCVVDATGRFLLVANYLGGNAAVFPIQGDGSLAERSCLIQHTGSGPDSRRQSAPHAHSINLSDDNRFGYVADLGIDRIMIYRFDDQRGLLVPSAVDPAVMPAGGGPRHFSLHPNGRFAYANNEMTAETSAFVRNPETGRLTLQQTISSLPEDFEGRRSTAECLVHPNGKFVYTSNRGHDSIAVYKIDQDSGRLHPVQIAKTGGREPRNFFILPNGKWLLAANQNSDTVVVFALDSSSGKLTETAQRISVGRPVCIRLLP